jgi:hypothetical protein
MNKNKILYWPGRGQNLDILKDFRKELETQGFKIECININYDEGVLHPYTWKQVVQNESNWWIGISLGASLLYYSMQFAGKIKPNRITLINPFSSREELSKERKFSLENQWNFAPIDYMEKVDNLDMVLSINDTKIPMYHGVKILNNTICENKQIIFINESHTIDNGDAQNELARVLGNYDILDRGIYNERYNYCNIYK